jgi:lipid-binding SYLF domain-containing protein
MNSIVSSVSALRKIVLLSAITAVFSVSAMADNEGTEKTTSQRDSARRDTEASKDLSRTTVEQYRILDGEHSQLISKAADAFVRVKNEADNKSLEALLPNAKCVAVFPGVAKAAILVGGSHGDGVVTCRTAERTVGTENEELQWSNISFLDLFKVSFGAELGIKGADVVMLFMNDKALQNLKDGKVTFGANAKAVFANRDLTATTATSRGDIIVYSNETGLFAGAGLDGTYIEVDESELQEFYDESITQVIALTTYDKMGRVKEVEQFMYSLDTDPDA